MAIQFSGCAYLSVKSGLRALEKKDYSTAAADFKKAADAGDPAGRYFLGTLYAEGKGVAKDEAKFMELLRASAEDGYAPAQAMLGLMYYAGSGVKRDYGKAAKWLRKAAEQEDGMACYYMGEMYATGRGVKRNNFIAVSYYRLALAYDFPVPDRLLDEESVARMR
jgi:TPR repeat protein